MTHESESREHSVISDGKARILFLITESYYFVTHKRQLAEAAKDVGLERVLAARIHDRNREVLVGMTLMDLAWRRPRSLIDAALRFFPDLFRVRRALRQADPAILHNIGFKAAFVGSLAAWGRPVKIINSINGFGFTFYSSSPLARLVQALCGPVFRNAVNAHKGWVLLQNPDDAALAERRFRLPPPRLRVIRGSGIEPEAFKPQPVPPSPPFTVLVLARLLVIKGIRVAVNSMRRIQSQGITIELVICGGPDPGNPSSIPEEEFRTWSKVPGVRVLGHVEDVRPVIASCHTVLLPALGGEGLPRALLEGAAMKKPLIASDIAGCREVVIPGKTGILVPPGDPAALCKAMVSLAADPTLQRKLGEAAHDHVTKNLSAAVIREAHVELYRTVMAELDGQTGTPLDR